MGAQFVASIIKEIPDVFTIQRPHIQLEILLSGLLFMLYTTQIILKTTSILIVAGLVIPWLSTTCPRQ